MARKQSPTYWRDRFANGSIRVEVWDERDRLHIGVEDQDTSEYVVSWWDDDARQMIEDGFFEQNDPGGPGRNRLERSVVAYLDETAFPRPEIALRPEQRARSVPMSEIRACPTCRLDPEHYLPRHRTEDD